MNKKIILSEQQNEALEGMIAFDKSPNEQMIRIKGSAGTGKTTLVGEYTKRSERDVVLTTPTHKAKHVLASKSHGVSVSTIQSALGLVLKRRNGEDVLVKSPKQTPIGGSLTTVILDEASMVDPSLLTFILNSIKDYGVKFILVGDHCQLPPPNYSTSIAFELDLSEFYLKKIERVALGSPIIQAATYLRDKIESSSKMYYNDYLKIPTGENEIGSVSFITKNEYIALSKRLYKSSDYSKNSNFIKTLSYTNTCSNNVNRFVNSLLGVPESETFFEGGVVIFNEAMVSGEKILVQNNVDGVVSSVVKKKSNGIYYDQLEIVFDQNAEVTERNLEFRVVRPESIQTYKEMLNKIRLSSIASGNWGQFYSFKEHYQDIRPNHAFTVHKSQGSEFNHSVLFLNDIITCGDNLTTMKLVYVALTRASHKTYIVI